MTATEHHVRIAMPDGEFLAATLFLPDPGSGPQPCLLEALPYRKDDLTSSYADTYRQIRDDHGYAVCRVDVRGTGSSSGDALDEYQEAEQSDLPAVIAWLAEQDWCDGNVGMWGTSYSGFNSLQIAAERPPALKAVCAIYSSDDRWTDDVHWRGGARRLVDLVDYCHYMTAMNVLPPVPALWGEGWQEEWKRRLDTHEPWLLAWLEHSSYDDYWRHGSIRPDYDRIQCPVMLVAGWADGYRNNSFRTMAALADSGVPHRLLAGPWAHADPTTAIPGPRIDFMRELMGWFDTHLRGTGTHEDRLDVFVRSSTPPAPDLEIENGRWVSLPSVPPTQAMLLPLQARPPLDVEPDVGTAAWIDCAGHLPWGLSTDQKRDDARSLTWDFDPPTAPVIGYPRVTVRLTVDQPSASLSVKLCAVSPDGASTLVSRGTRDLRFREGVHGSPQPLVPGEEIEVSIDLDACAYEWAPDELVRVSIAGTDWPNTIAPPAPLCMEVVGGSLDLPVLAGHFPAPELGSGQLHSNESADGVVWEIADDVLRRRTVARTRYGSPFSTGPDARASEDYEGEVWVDRRDFTQGAHATTTYTLDWPGISVEVRSTLDVGIDSAAYSVTIQTVAFSGGEEISRREWTRRYERD